MLRLFNVRHLAVFIGLIGFLALSTGCEQSAGPPPSPEVSAQKQKEEADARRAAYGQAGIPTGKGLPKPAAK
jgi:hypothetical protein